MIQGLLAGGGAAVFLTGCYLTFGLGVALMVAGVLCLVLGLLMDVADE